MNPFEIGYGVDAVLNPESVAVIGVSGDSGKAEVTGGTAILSNMIRYGFGGRIYPVNPKYDAIMGLRCYATVADVPETVDLAVVAIAADGVPGVLEACGRCGCRAAIVISSGFGEVQTPHGAALQKEIDAVVKTYGIRVVGPNNLGSYNTFDKMVASTSAALMYYNELPPGGIAWVTQSGALGTSLYGRAIDQNIGVGYVVTTGNESDLQTADFVWYLLDDPRIHVIGLYIEGIRDWERFEAAAQKARKLGKPILAYKAGVTKSGGAALKVHTDSDAGDFGDYLDFFRRTGVVAVESVDELYRTAFLLEQWRGYGDIRNIAILTTSGGSGGILADGLTRLGMNVPELSRETQEKIKREIPAFGSAVNPIDVTAHIMRTPEKIARVGNILEETDEVDAIMYAPTTLSAEGSVRIARDIVALIRESKKPCLVHWYSSPLNSEAIHILHQNQIPTFTDYDSIVQSFRSRNRSVGGQPQVRVLPHQGPCIAERKNSATG